MEYPLRVLRYSMVPDSGGPGTYRGGLSIRKDIQALAPVLFSAHSDRHRFPPWGLVGGHPGRCGRFLLNPGTPIEKTIQSKISGLLVEKGETISAQTAGGGGYGSPIDRKPELVAQDYLDGKISMQKARAVYGVALTHGGQVDWTSTQTLRELLRNG
jgi:N-methylhydantoinase B